MNLKRRLNSRKFRINAMTTNISYGNKKREGNEISVILIYETQNAILETMDGFHFIKKRPRK